MNINKDNVKQVLIDSVASDAEQFCFYWASMSVTNPAEFPVDLSEDQWIEQFWAWMEGA